MTMLLTERQADEGWCCRHNCCGPGSWCCAHADAHSHPVDSDGEPTGEVIFLGPETAV